MNDSNLQDQPTNANLNGQTKQADAASKRSASYPSVTTLQAYDFALKINDKFSNQEVTRKEIATALGMNDSYISRPLAAVAAYGFADRKKLKGETDNRYNLTQLFNDIFLKESEKQKKISLITAFGNPKLFNNLISKFDGGVIPQELPNTLIKHHDIAASAAQEVADIFIKSGQEVGVINESRVLNYKVTLSSIQKTQYAEIIDDDTKENDSNNFVNTASKGALEVLYDPTNQISNADKKVPIHLTKDKMAYLVYPANITANDIKLIDHQIQGVLLRLQLENEETG